MFNIFISLVKNFYNSPLKWALTLLKMCINQAKSRNKYHNVVYLFVGGGYTINDLCEGARNSVLCGTSAR